MNELRDPWNQSCKPTNANLVIMPDRKSTEEELFPPPPRSARLQISLLLAIIVTIFLQIVYHESSHNFWNCSYPNQLPGILRIFIYSGILLLSLVAPATRPPSGDSPLQAHSLWEFTLPNFRGFEGCAKILPSFLINYKTLRLLQSLVLIGFILSILGVGGQTPPTFTAFGYLILHGINQFFIKVNHRWHVPTLTLVALAFANGRGSLSVDYFLSNHFPHYPFNPSESNSSILNASLSRKIVLATGIFTLWAGGISKLLNSGLAWSNGHPLKFFMSFSGQGTFPPFKRFLLSSHFIVAFLSFSSLVFELLSPVALFLGPIPVLLFTLATVAFHVSIWLTMKPNYWPQTLCYALGVHWEYFLGYDEHSNCVQSELPSILISFCVTLFFGVWFFATFFRIEFWPISSIPMYSFYRHGPEWDRRWLRDLKQAKFAGDEPFEFGYPYIFGWSPEWVKLEIVCNENRLNILQLAQDSKTYKRGITGKHLDSILFKIIRYELNGEDNGKKMVKILASQFKTCEWNLPKWVEDSKTEFQVSINLKEGLHCVIKVLWNN